MLRRAIPGFLLTILPPRSLQSIAGIWLMLNESIGKCSAICQGNSHTLRTPADWQSPRLTFVSSPSSRRGPRVESHSNTCVRQYCGNPSRLQSLWVCADFGECAETIEQADQRSANAGSVLESHRSAGSYAFVGGKADGKRLNRIFHVTGQVEVLDNGPDDKGLFRIAQALMPGFVF